MKFAKFFQNSFSREQFIATEPEKCVENKYRFKINNEDTFSTKHVFKVDKKQIIVIYLDKVTEVTSKNIRETSIRSF